MMFIASFAVLLVSLSAAIDTRRNASIGSKAPSLTVERADSIVTLDGLQGKRVVLSFWSAADGESRLLQNKISAMVSSVADANPTAKNVEVLSVNLDRSERLMREIVRLDNLDNDSQFFAGNSGYASQIRDAYEMKNGLRTFIIDEEGRIEKVDPTEDELIQVLNPSSGPHHQEQS